VEDILLFEEVKSITEALDGMNPEEEFCKGGKKRGGNLRDGYTYINLI